MIPIIPKLQFQIECPYCKTPLNNKNLIWQGMHICTDATCLHCHKEFLCDLPSNQATVTPYLFDKLREEFIPIELATSNDRQFKTHGSWTKEENFFTGIFKEIKNNPQKKTIDFKIKRFIDKKKVIILNTLDYIYGHSSLFLFNAEMHLKHNPDYGLILIIQPFLLWLVPEGVAEVWVFDLPMKTGMKYFPNISSTINKELHRFQEVLLSRAEVQPVHFDISRFTRIPHHNFTNEDFRITIVWRQDTRRMWLNEKFLTKVTRKLGFSNLLRFWQRQKILKLLRLLHKKIPEARLTVAGLGQFGSFPLWIEDCRISKFDEENERKLCKIYAESQLIVGVHGSSLILPSAQAGMTICLMPKKRWGNFAQDLVFIENDDRLSLYQKRILPIETSVYELADICEHMIRFRNSFLVRMVLPFIGNSNVRKKLS